MKTLNEFLNDYYDSAEFFEEPKWLSEARVAKEKDTRINIKNPGQAADRHSSYAEEHDSVAQSLENTAKVLHPSQSARLLHLANLHRRAAEHHRSAANSWDIVAGSRTGKRENTQIAKEASGKALTSSDIAASPNSLRSSENTSQPKSKLGFLARFKLLRKKSTSDQEHDQAAAAHERAAKKLSRTAGVMTDPEHTERLNSMAEAHSNAAQSHRIASEHIKKFRSGNLIGSGARERTATEASEYAHRMSEEANNT